MTDQQTQETRWQSRRGPVGEDEVNNVTRLMASDRCPSTGSSYHKNSEFQAARNLGRGLKPLQ